MTLEKLLKRRWMRWCVFVGALTILPSSVLGEVGDHIRGVMASVNAQLGANGANYRLEIVEYLTLSDEIGREVFFSDVGNKQLGHHFVPGDPRRAAWSGPVGPGDNIRWASDLIQGDATVGLAATQTAISNAMATWQAQNCSTIPLSGSLVPVNLGVVEFILSSGASGFPAPVADITHAGFSTPVDAILPSPIIAATCTFVFLTSGGSFSDIDNNGKLDTAFREIYYTGNFPWGINTNFPIDVETVALHEAGHGLSQAHYGKLFRTDSNGRFHFAPGALMNAGYTGIQQKLSGTDLGGHCSIWSSWPNN